MIDPYYIDETEHYGCDCGAPHDCTGYCIWYCSACIAQLDQEAAHTYAGWLAYQRGRAAQWN